MTYNTTVATENFIHSDGSGAMFDLPPRTAIWGYGAYQEGGTYDIPRLPRYQQNGEWMGWSQWIEKWQKDFRFAAVSDYNAAAQPFPEVHDPWMFTEYPFEGTDRSSDRDDSTEVGDQIIEPALVDPTRTNRDINTIGWPTQFVLSNSKPVTIIPRGEKSLYELEPQWESVASKKRYWESQLVAMQWREDYTTGDPPVPTVNTRFSRLNITRRVVKMKQPELNAGVRLYHQSVWAKSLRWGYSQNVPERTINMTGPMEFFRPEGIFTGRIVPNVQIKSGTPVYDNLTNSPAGQQAVFWANNLVVGLFANDAVIRLKDVTPTGIAGPPDSIFTYPTGGSDGTNVPLPKLGAADVASYKFVELNFAAGDLVHRGCAFWEGKNGEAKCRYYWTNQSFQNGISPVTHPTLCAMNAETGDPTQNRDAYVAAGGQCPHYTPQGRRVLTAYEGIARTQQQLNRMQRLMNQGMPGTSAMPGLGGELISHAVPPPPDRTIAGRDPNEGYSKTRIEITYEPEIVPLQGKQVYHDTPDGLPANSRSPSDSLRIKSGTGMFPIDERSGDPLGGIDTPFFGVINQINYRVMRNVMHCYKADRCDSIIAVQGNRPGWRRGRFSNIDFTNHPLKMPGYPGIDGTDSECHYGDGSCPYNRLDRRAVEFDENYQLLLREILNPFRSQGIDWFSRYGIFQGILIDGELTLVDDEDAESTLQQNPTAMLVAIRKEDGSVPLIGHWQPTVPYMGDTYRIFFYYTRHRLDPQHKSSAIASHIVQFDNDDQPVFMSPPPDREAEFSILFSSPESVPWITPLIDNYEPPIGNATWVTNRNPTWGGRSPEYKDHQQRGREVICDWGYFTQNRTDSETQSNQFGGVRWGSYLPEGKGKRGYWTDSDGEFIIGGDTVGQPAVNYTDPQTVQVNPRIQNVPPRVGDNIPINGVPGIMMQGATPETSRAGSFASVAATYSNDTKALLDWFREATFDPGPPARWVTNWEKLLPEDPLSPTVPPSKIPVAPPAGIGEMLPTERPYYRCGVCGSDATAEEINFLRTVDEYAVTPGSPTSTVKCPRKDGGVMAEVGGMDRIPSSLSRGHIEFWAPPGSTVRANAMYWKNPTLITRAIETQMSQKLGQYNPAGGGYHFNGLTPGVEQMGKLPTPNQRSSYDPGINRQMTVPLAAPGQSISTIRSNVMDLFHLGRLADQGATDVAIIARPGQAETDVINESSTTVQFGDTVRFERRGQDGYRSPVGILISVGLMAPSPSLLAESLVANDQVRPNANQYNTSLESEVRRLQSDTRDWLLNAVSNSIAHWATAISAHPNLLSKSLEDRGLNPSLGKPFHPGSAPGSSSIGSGAGPIEIDERIIDAYAQDKDSEGLKLITRTQFQRLRNRIIPMLAYDLSDSSSLYSAGGDYTTTRQASNQNRFSAVRREIPQSKWNVIAPQVMAANDAGLDDYVEWKDPDLVMETGRAYFPTGTTWWRLNQRVGNIKRAGGSNPLHMDADPAALPLSTYQRYLDRGMSPYTGNVVSTCTFFIHGRLPMDKDVVRAYLIFTPDDGPSAGALGCLGQYDGYVGARARSSYGFQDNIAPGTDRYVGNEECFFQHFHPWTTSHESDIGAYTLGADDDDYGQWDSPGYAGSESMVHWTESPTQDDNTPWFTSDCIITPMSSTGREMIIQGDRRDWSWRDPLLDEQILYRRSAEMLGMSYSDSSWGFDLVQGILDTWSFGEDLTQLVTEHHLWKDLTFAEYESVIDKFSARVSATANTTGARVTFSYVATPFRQKVYQRNHQGIAGWLNYENYDTSGKFPKAIAREEQAFDAEWANGPQIIVQAGITLDAGASSTPYPSGGGPSGTGSAGNVERVLDVTSEMQRQYNQRVTRYFNVKLGVGYESLFDLVRGVADTNILDTHPDNLTENGLARRFHTGSDYDPTYYWNYRYMHHAGIGMWMNDPWHHPPIINDQVVTQSTAGDPIILSEQDRMLRIEDVTDWDQQGHSDEHADYMQYHPWTLCQSDTSLFDDTVGSSIRPIPVETEGQYWRVADHHPSAQWFTVDVRQTPYELWRRPFRYKAPDVDSSNATCPNTKGCWVASQGLTVGELYEQNAHKIFGSQLPSTSSSRCSVCNTTLENVAFIDGDGITTVEYDPYESPNAIINGIEISVATSDEWHPTVKHGFTVEVFNSVSSEWHSLLHVGYDNNAGKYSYRTWNGTSWVWGMHNNLPIIFQGANSDQFGNPIKGTASSGAHFAAAAGMKVRFKVTRPGHVNVAEPSIDGWGTPTAIMAGEKQIVVASLGGDPSKYVGRTIKLQNTSNTDEQSYSIVEITPNESGHTIHLNAAVKSGHTKYRIEWTEFISRCTKFRVYGFPYRPGEVVITPPAKREIFILSDGTGDFALPDHPTQVLRVEAKAGDDPAINMIPGNPGGAGWHWEVEDVTYGGVTYKRITAGKYHYDYTRNIIQIPTTFIKNGVATSIWMINDDLYNSDTPLLFDTVPSALHVDYFTGLGVSVECPIESVGQGPSYQLDQESICFLARNTQDDEEIPNEIESDPLPPIGESVPLKSLAGDTYSLDWRCYNHDITVWNGGVKWISGDEMGAGEYGESSIVSFFTGGRSRQVSDLGPSAKIHGTTTGTIHIYGAPGIILSGKLAAYAKDTTKRQYHSTGTDPVVTYERTGGFKEGVIFFRMDIQDTITNGRKSVSCNVPKLLVWLKERELTSPV